MNDCEGSGHSYLIFEQIVMMVRAREKVLEISRVGRIDRKRRRVRSDVCISMMMVCLGFGCCMMGLIVRVGIGQC